MCTVWVDNDLKKTTRKLADAESRLLAMSVELAKARGQLKLEASIPFGKHCIDFDCVVGKPSLEETFSTSDQSECLGGGGVIHPAKLLVHYSS